TRKQHLGVLPPICATRARPSRSTFAEGWYQSTRGRGKGVGGCNEGRVARHAADEDLHGSAGDWCTNGVAPSGAGAGQAAEPPGEEGREEARGRREGL